MSKQKGEKLKMRVSAVADKATFNPATATKTPLRVRSADLSTDREGFSFDRESEEAQAFWADAEQTVSRSWSISLDGYFHHDDAGYLIVENAVWRETVAGAAAGELIYVWYYPQGDAAGAPFRHGFALPGQLGVPTDVAGSVDASFDFVGDGKLNRGVVPTV